MKRILIVGDAIEDVYTSSSFKKMCPDAPGVPAAVYTGRESVPGGAANVALNVAALEQSCLVDLVSIMNLGTMMEVKRRSGHRVDMSYSTKSDTGLVKERISVDKNVILRLDNSSHFSQDDLDDLEANLGRYFKFHTPDLILLSDYDAGTFTRVFPLVERLKDRLLVDTKQTDLSVFSRDGMKTMLAKFNGDEWSEALKVDHTPNRHFRSTVITRGEDGAKMMLHERLGERQEITHSLEVAAHKVDVVDVCGCGDTFLAGLGVSLLRNDDVFTAMQFANAAASTVVAKERTAVADLKATLRLVGRE